MQMECETCRIRSWRVGDEAALARHANGTVKLTRVATVDSTSLQAIPVDSWSGGGRQPDNLTPRAASIRQYLASFGGWRAVSTSTEVVADRLEWKQEALRLLR